MSNIGAPQLRHQRSHETPTSKRYPFGHSTTFVGHRVQ